MITYKINEELRIIEVKRLYSSSYKEYFKYLDNLLNETSHMKSLYILDDATQVKFSMKPNDVKNEILETIKRISHLDYVKNAIIVDNPYNTAISLLYEILTKDLANFKYRVFSTHEAAKIWLLSNRN